jgi:hypothetical protein
MIIKNFRYHKNKHGEYDFNCTYVERKNRVNIMLINNTDKLLRFYYKNNELESGLINIYRYFTKEFELRPMSTMFFKLPNSTWTLHCRTTYSFTRRKIIGVYAQPTHHPSLGENLDMIKMFILLNKIAKEIKPNINFDINDVDEKVITDHDKKMIKKFLQNNTCAQELLNN